MIVPLLVSIHYSASVVLASCHSQLIYLSLVVFLTGLLAVCVFAFWCWFLLHWLQVKKLQKLCDGFWGRLLFTAYEMSLDKNGTAVYSSPISNLCMLTEYVKYFIYNSSCSAGKVYDIIAIRCDAQFLWLSLSAVVCSLPLMWSVGGTISLSQSFDVRLPFSSSWHSP